MPESCGKLFEFQCTFCGAAHAVHAVQAGGDLLCQCGRNLLVPRLSQLRASAGKEAYKPSIVARIKKAVETEVPARSVSECQRCGLPAERRPMVAICERTSSSIVSSGGDSGGFVAGFIGGLPFVIPLGGANAGEATETQTGSSLVAPITVYTCDSCWTDLTIPVTLKALRALTWCSFSISGVLLAIWFCGPAFDASFSILPALVLSTVWACFAIGLSLCRRTSRQRLSQFMSADPLYEELLQEYPDAAIVAGELHEHCDAAAQDRRRQEPT